MIHCFHLNEKMQFLIKVIYYLFICIERELKKTPVILTKNYLVKIIIIMMMK